jgi:D-alanyl-D-alanine carboxypeptidase/D-alanyl-D-alanine-endopeptidase (penicillin-binding protein 4)
LSCLRFILIKLNHHTKLQLSSFSMINLRRPTLQICLSSFVALSFVPAGRVAQSRAESLCSAQLATTITRVIQRPTLRSAYWGILVQPLTPSDSPLYSYNADQLFLPASNAKLLTTAAAMVALKPQFKYQTPVLATGRAPVLSTLRLIGQGDPSLGDPQLEQIALTLQSKGIQQIDTLIGDDSKFTGNLIEPSWAWEDLQGGDGLPINSLMLNGNVRSLQLTPQVVGQPLKLQWLSSTIPRALMLANQTMTVPASAPEFVETSQDGDQLTVQGQLHAGAAPETIDVPIPQPGIAFLERFRALLNAHHIRVNRLSLATTFTPRLQDYRVTAINSPPLSMLITHINQDSDNFYAEALLRQLGATQASRPTPSTAEQGIKILGQTLTQLGVASQGYQLVDGSGLSRKNLVSPRALVQTLQAIAQSPYGEVFRSTLAVAGESGTLKQRFLGTVVKGQFQGKTGSLQGTAALAGYLNRSPADPLVLSIVVNHSTQAHGVLRQAVDEVVLAIAQAKDCRANQSLLHDANRDLRRATHNLKPQNFRRRTS